MAGPLPSYPLLRKGPSSLTALCKTHPPPPLLSLFFSVLPIYLSLCSCLLLSVLQGCKLQEGKDVCVFVDCCIARAGALGFVE